MSFETYVYNRVKKFPWMKDILRTAYQAAMLPWLGRRYSSTYPLITRPGYFFGFHDKTPWCPENRRILAHRLTGNFEPGEEAVEVGFFTDSELSEFVVLDKTKAWSKQQGAQLQWSGSGTDIMYNVRRHDDTVAAVLVRDLGTERHELDYPIGAVDGNGQYACVVEFGSFGHGMAGYGYGAWAYQSYRQRSDDTVASGLTEIELSSGRVIPRFGIGEMLAFVGWEQEHSWHSFISHPAYSPSGDKVAFMIRRASQGRRVQSKLCVYHRSSDKLTVVRSGTMVSHYCWIDDDRIVAFLETEDGKDAFRVAFASAGTTKPANGLPERDGHPHFSQTSGRLVVDSYPNRRRRQGLYVYQLTGEHEFEMLEAMSFYSPMRYSNEDRVDLHPRWDRDGERLCIDSSFTGLRSLTILSRT